MTRLYSVSGDLASENRENYETAVKEIPIGKVGRC